MKKKKSLLYLFAGYAAILIFVVAAVLITGRSYSIYFDESFAGYTIDVEYSQEGILSDKVVMNGNTPERVVFTGLKKGNTDVDIHLRSATPDAPYTVLHFQVEVLSSRVAFFTDYDFGGFRYVVVGFALVTMLSCAFFARQFIYRKKRQFFSYKTVLDLSLSIFFGLQCFLYIGLSVACFIAPERYDGWIVYNLAGFLMSGIFICSIPLLILVALFLIISNLGLIRHEGFARGNAFGLLISALLLGGAALCIYTIVTEPGSTGVSYSEVRDAVIRTIVSSAFVYFECILLGTQICTRYAARHTPRYNQDFIVILGCKTRADGTPLPLLQGRIDKAIEFYRAQLEQTGKQACFIPSGGQGKDEIMPEAESMRNYLIEQGIDAQIIYPETASVSTLENMRFSKAIADEHCKDANILFATTNYHVFRSGILSAKAGLRADGIGAKTKWYFWPNAQMREFIGLLVGEWKINLLFVALMVGLSTLFANLGNIVDYVVR